MGLDLKRSCIFSIHPFGIQLPHKKKKNRQTWACPADVGRMAQPGASINHQRDEWGIDLSVANQDSKPTQYFGRRNFNINNYSL